MGKLTRKGPPYKGDGWKTWQSSARLRPEEVKDTRQQQRARARKKVWARLSGELAPTDDNGIIARKVRRDMCRQIVKRMPKRNAKDTPAAQERLVN